MPLDIPHNAFVVVADGVGARFFRNAGTATTLRLTADGELQPSHLHADGPAGSCSVPAAGSSWYADSVVVGTTGRRSRS